MLLGRRNLPRRRRISFKIVGTRTFLIFCISISSVWAICHILFCNAASREVEDIYRTQGSSSVPKAEFSISKDDPPSSIPSPSPQPSGQFPRGHFAVLLPGMRDLVVLSPTLCRLAHTGHTFSVVLYSQVGIESASDHLMAISPECTIHYSYLPWDESPRITMGHISFWIKAQEMTSDVILYATSTRYEPAIKLALQETVIDDQSHTPTIISIPIENLAHLEWAGTLSLEEWTGKKL